MHDVGLLVPTIEGLQYSRGGVGRFVRNLLGEMPRTLADLGRQGLAVTVHLAEPRISSDHQYFDQELWCRTSTAVLRHGGSVTRLVNDSAGTETWGGWQNFHALSAATAQLAAGLRERHDSLVVLSGTSVYALLPLLYLRQFGVGDDRVLFLHTHGMAIPWATPPAGDELIADSVVATLARNDPRVRIGYISEFMRDVSVRGYGVPERRLLPNITGIRLDDPRFAPRPEEECADRLRRLGVPVDRPLIVAWGRNSARGLDKGYELLLRACARLTTAVTPVLMLRDADARLQRLGKTLGLSAIVLEGQPFDSIAAALQWPDTAAAVFTAADDPGAAGPLEAMATASHGGAIVVAARSGSYPDVIVDGETGLLADRNEESLAERLGVALDMAPDDRETMRQQAMERVRSLHDFSRNMYNLLASLGATVSSGVAESALAAEGGS